MNRQTLPNCFPIPVTITKEGIIVSSESIPVITYVGGYCCYTINEKLKCDACNLRIVFTNGNENSFNYSLLKDINRGSLLYSSADIAYVVLKNYQVVQTITECDKFS